MATRSLYGDTDSVFVLSGVSREAARELGSELAAWLNQGLTQHVMDTWGVPSRLEMEFEQLYLRLFLPRARGGEAAMKRYAGLVETETGTEVSFVGLEAVRRDWTDLAKEVQRNLYERMFLDQEVEEYLRGVVAELRAGHYDEALIYRKAMRKAESEYTTTTPPHVAAARKMSTPPGRLIEYAITTGGPEPAEELKFPIDYQHYVEKQIYPIAKPVLDLLELDFEQVIGDDWQMGLFE